MGKSPFIKNLLEQLKKRIRGARSRGEAVRVFTRGKHPPNKTNQQKRTPTPTKTTKTKTNPPRITAEIIKRKDHSTHTNQPTPPRTRKKEEKKKQCKIKK